jgi:hypothetical protein
MLPGALSKVGIVALCAALAACSTIGNKFDPAAVQELRPGVSTVQDAVAKLGPYVAESTQADNSRILRWLYAQGSMFGASAARVEILFDAEGRMVRVTHKGIVNN